MTYYGASELARSFRTVRKNTLAIAEDIPEDTYDSRPTPECRSAREILAHIAVSSRRSYQGHAVQKVRSFAGIDWPTYIRERQEQEQQLTGLTKAQLVEDLRADGDAWGAYLDTVPEEELAVVIPFSPPAEPPTKSRFEMLLSAKEHEMHHRGQLMVFERLLGLVPHLTRQRQARMAPAPVK